MSVLTRFFPALTILTVLCAGFTALVHYTTPVELPAHVIIVFVYLYLAAIGIHKLFLWANREKSAAVINYFMAIIFGKMIISVIVLLGLIVIDIERASEVAVLFFILYLLFTFLEVFFMVRTIRQEGS